MTHCRLSINGSVTVFLMTCELSMQRGYSSRSRLLQGPLWFDLLMATKRKGKKTKYEGHSRKIRDRLGMAIFRFSLRCQVCIHTSRTSQKVKYINQRSAKFGGKHVERGLRGTARFTNSKLNLSPDDFKLSKQLRRCTYTGGI